MTSEIFNNFPSQPPCQSGSDFELITAALAEPLVIFDRHGKPCFMNPAARKLLAGSLIARLSAHLHTDTSRRPVLQVRFPLDKGGTIVLKISRNHIEWRGQAAVLVSLNDITAYITAFEDSQASFNAKSQKLTVECAQLRQRLHESEKSEQTLTAKITSLETRLQETVTAHEAELAELKEEVAQQLALAHEPTETADATPSKENIIAAAMRKAWAVRGQTTNTDTWGTPVSD